MDWKVVGYFKELRKWIHKRMDTIVAFPLEKSIPRVSNPREQVWKPTTLVSKDNQPDKVGEG
jgi:hypothetical protein